MSGFLSRVKIFLGIYREQRCREERKGKERKGKELSLATVAQSVLKGLVVRCIYALVALGMTLNFGMMTNIQFAYGEIYM